MVHAGHPSLVGICVWELLKYLEAVAEKEKITGLLVIIMHGYKACCSPVYVTVDVDDVCASIRK